MNVPTIQEPMAPSDRWKFTLGSFVYDFAQLEAYVVLFCASFVGIEQTKNLTFGKRLDRIKEHVPLYFAERAEALLTLLDDARAISNFRNTILHNPVFYWAGMHIPEHGHPGEIWAMKSGRVIKIEEVEGKLDSLKALMSSWREQDHSLGMYKFESPTKA
ncbi:MAG: hypothetical protein ACJ8LG_17015 [Massilia sp.]